MSPVPTSVSSVGVPATNGAKFRGCGTGGFNMVGAVTSGSVLDHSESVRLYGPWKHRTPEEARTVLRGYSGRWWIAGGWAIDAYTKTTRRPGDLDIGIPKSDLDAFVHFVSPQFDTWAAAGSLTPIFPGNTTQIPATCGNLWLRPHGAAPWEYDVLLERVQEDTWTYKRDPQITRALADCLWAEDDITYLRPEVQLLLKAKHMRVKDTEDLERCLPFLDAAALDWLICTLRFVSPEHPWLKRLYRPMR
jgi:hypothetical protein